MSFLRQAITPVFSSGNESGTSSSGTATRFGACAAAMSNASRIWNTSDRSPAAYVSTSSISVRSNGEAIIPTIFAR